MTGSCFQLDRTPGGRRRIVFAHGVKAGDVAQFLESRGARPVGSREDSLGDFHDVEYQLGWARVELCADNWMVMIDSRSRFADFVVLRLARALARDGLAVRRSSDR